MASPEPEALLLDLDGTLYQGDAALPGAVAAIAALRSRGTPFRCVTNTSSRSRSMLVSRLAAFGFDITPQEIVTSVRSAASMARARGWHRVAPFLRDAALEDLDPLEMDRATPDAIIVGDLGEEWSHSRMQEAFELLLGGAKLIACSRDRYWQRGTSTVIDCGAFVAGLEYAAGVTALVAGKPAPEFFREAAEPFGLPASSIIMTGDDIWSDVGGAQAAGMRGWLVRTGKYRERAVVESGIRPDRIIGSVAELTG